MEPTELKIGEIVIPKTLYELQSNYNNIRVVEEGSIRKLVFGDSGLCHEQSAINVEKLHENVFDYSLLAMHSFLFIPDPERVLVVGLGGGVLPRQISYYFINTQVDVIEIDPEIISVAKEFFFFEETDKIKIYNGDAYAVLSVLKDKYDIIILDAFSSNYIPFHLMSKEFYAYVLCNCKEESVVASNVCNWHPSFLSQINTMASVFGQNIYRLDGSRNVMTSLLYAVMGGLKPIKIAKTMCHFLGVQPEPIVMTDEIKSAKIFSLI